MRSSGAMDNQGALIQKPTCIMSYNTKMGCVDHVDQQLHSVSVMRKNYKWYKKIFVCMLMMCILNAHKLYQLRGGRIDFLQFIHDVITLLLVNSPRLQNSSKAPRDNILHLTGRHFPGQISYDGGAAKKKSVSKMCRVCYVQGRHLHNGNKIYTTNVCPDCPGQPELCSGNCFRTFHTVFDYSQ